MTQSGKHTQSQEALPDEGQEALSLLRNVWSAHGQTSQDIEQSSSGASGHSGKSSHPRGCKDLTFEAMAEEVEPTTDTGEAVSTLRTAWRKKLEEDGKLEREGKTLRDIVLGDADST